MYKKIIYIALFTPLLLLATNFQNIKFEGLSKISDEVALEIAKFTPNEVYTDQNINNSIKEFYKFGYFKDISVKSEDNTLIFTFKEKPYIANLEMVGYKTREDDLELIFSDMNMKKGNMYSVKRIEFAKERLLSMLGQEGYINSVVEVEIKNINENSVSVKFVVNKGAEVIIQKVNYKGSKYLDIDAFEDVTANKEADCCFTWWFGRNDGKMSFEQLEYDGMRIKEAYLEKGFLDAKLEQPFSRVDFNTNTAEIDIKIKEGKQYRINDIIIYVDEDIVKVADIYPELKLQKTKVFNVKKLRKDIEYIKTQVANKGYAFTKVKYDLRKDIKKATADLIYNVQLGDKVYINDIIISGNIRTLDRVIRRNIYLAPGDLYSLTDFQDSKNNLNRTGFFEEVKIEEQRISKNKMNLLVNVKEAPTGNLVFGGGYGSYDGFMLNASVSDKNIFGSGMKLGLSLDWSKKTQNYSASLSNPALWDSKYSGSASVYKTDSKITYTDDELNKNTVGFSLGVGKKFTRHSFIGTIYSYDKTKEIYDINSSLNNNYVVSAVTPYINFNNTDSYFVPRKGIIASTSLQIAGLGGDGKYLKSSSYFKYFKDLENYLDYDAIFRYKASLKLLEDTGYIPPGSSFYLGGTDSIRGYKTFAFGPAAGAKPYDRMFANSVELSFPLIAKSKMRWGVFLDSGMIGEGKFTTIKRSGTGALIEWISPVGPLQFIFSKPLDDKPGDATSTFEFSLGSKF